MEKDHQDSKSNVFDNSGKENIEPNISEGLSFTPPDPISFAEDNVVQGKLGLSPKLSKSLANTPPPPNDTGQNNSNLRGTVLNKMEHAFQANFATVEIHKNSNEASQLNALAFTQGENIHFAPGFFNPDSHNGQQLIGHELTHVLQQREGRVTPNTQFKGFALNQDARLEAEADAWGAKAASLSNLTTAKGVALETAISPAPPMAQAKVIQRTCNALAQEFDLENLDATSHRRLESRIRACAAQDLATFRRNLARAPNLPAEARRLPAAQRNYYNRIRRALRISLRSIERHSDEVQRRVRKEHLERFQNLMGDKAFTYYVLTVPGIDTTLTSIGNPSTDFSDPGLDQMTGENRMMRQSADTILQYFIENIYHRRLDVGRTRTSGDSAYGGGSGERANAPPIPASLVGPSIQVRNSIGTYTMRLDYSIAGRDLLSQVAEAMNYVNYRWEVFDISTLYQRHIDQQVARIQQSRTEGTPVPTTRSSSDREIGEMAHAPPSEPSAVGRMDATARRTQMAGEALEEERRDAVRGIIHPFDTSDGTTVDAIGNAVVNTFNLATADLHSIFTYGGLLVDAVADLMGGTYYEKEIPFPNRDGYYLIRCIAQPSPQGVEDDILRAPSVATKVVRVMDIERQARRELEDQDANIEARINQVLINLRLETDQTNRQQLQEELRRLRTEQTGTASNIINVQIQRLEEQKRNTTSMLEIRRIDQQLRVLRERLSVARDREDDFSEGTTVYRPRAVLISEETSQSYPLLIQLALVSQNPLRGSRAYHYRVSDVTTENGGTAEGYGRTPADAATRAFEQFSGQCAYGRGRLVVRLPRRTPFSLNRTAFRCSPRHGAQFTRNLEELALVLTMLGLLAVPGAGAAATVLGAGVAANRILTRINNHTFRWDTAAVTDVISIVSAAATGVSSLGRMRVVRTARQFAVVSNEVEVIEMIGRMQRFARGAAAVERGLGWAGFLWGNIVVLHELQELKMKEIRGEITHAQARRDRSHKILNAIRDGAMQYAGEMQGGDDSPGDHGHLALPEGTPDGHQEGHPTPEAHIDPETTREVTPEGEIPPPESEPLPHDEPEPIPHDEPERIPEEEPERIPEDEPERIPEDEPTRIPPVEEAPRTPEEQESRTQHEEEAPVRTEEEPTPSHSEAPPRRRTTSERNAAADAFIREHLLDLLGGDEVKMQQLLNIHGVWRDLMVHLTGGDVFHRVIADHIDHYRGQIVRELGRQFDAHPAGNASTQPISDVDLSTHGPDAGQNLIDAENYMRDTYGPDWSQLFRMNFYSDAVRLSMYQGIMSSLTPQQRGALQNRISHLTEIFNFAKMLQHAHGNSDSIARIERLMRGRGDVETIRQLANMSPSERRSRRDSIHVQIDTLIRQMQREDISPEVHAEIAIAISEMQIEANYLTEEAYIGPGAARMVVGDVPVVGHEAYQAALSNLEMMEHIIHEAGGDPVRAARDYEIFKYMYRFALAARRAGVELPHSLVYIEHIGREIYRDQRSLHQDIPVTNEFLQNQFDDFMGAVEEVLPRILLAAQSDPAAWHEGGPRPGTDTPDLTVRPAESPREQSLPEAESPPADRPAPTEEPQDVPSSERPTGEFPAIRPEGREEGATPDQSELVVRSTPERYHVHDSIHQRLSVFAYVQNGTLVIQIRTALPDGTRSPVLRGAEQFRQIMQHFTGQFERIQGSWQYGSNLERFNELTGQNIPPNIAAQMTWTGQQAAEFGFDTAVIDQMDGERGTYTMVKVFFVRHGTE